MTKVPEDLVSGESPLPGLQMAVFQLFPHIEERGGGREREERENSPVFSIRALTPFMKIPFS